jgi:hypothetical protein
MRSERDMEGRVPEIIALYSSTAVLNGTTTRRGRAHQVVVRELHVGDLVDRPRLLHEEHGLERICLVAPTVQLKRVAPEGVILVNVAALDAPRQSEVCAAGGPSALEPGASAARVGRTVEVQSDDLVGVGVVGSRRGLRRASVAVAVEDSRDRVAGPRARAGLQPERACATQRQGSARRNTAQHGGRQGRE